MPDVVIEVASKTDTWSDVTAKVDKYIADGALFAVAIDPETSAVYDRGSAPADLALDYEAIINA